MRKCQLILPALLTVFVGCKSNTTSASVDPTVQAIVHTPKVTFTPSVWETAGSEIVPSLKMTTPAHDVVVNYRFEYEGDGEVELPDMITLQPGETELQVRSPFRTQSVNETVQGIVRVKWSHPTLGDHIVGQWNVVQRASILRELRVARAGSLVEGGDWDVTYAITIEMDPVEEWVDSAVAMQRDIFFQASAGSGERSPELEVLMDVDSTDYAAFPADIIPVGPHKAYIVCVKRPKLPQRKRPFLHVKARSGGDELERYLKLPF